MDCRPGYCTADQFPPWHKSLNPPPTSTPGRLFHAENSGRLTRLKRNIEAIERVGEPVTERLDEGFLTGPAREEREGLVARVEGAVGLALTPGKHAGCDVVGVGNHPHGFDVDSDLAPEGKRIDGHVVAVRYAESQVRSRDTSRERRLAAFPVHQLDRVEIGRAHV